MDDLQKLRWRAKLNRIKSSKFVQNLKRQAEENPVIVLVAAAAIITASAKLVNAIGHAKGSRAYARQVDYRITRNK